MGISRWPLRHKAALHHFRDLQKGHGRSGFAIRESVQVLQGHGLGAVQDDPRNQPRLNSWTFDEQGRKDEIQEVRYREKSNFAAREGNLNGCEGRF
jgi:hypothetical protein